MLLEDFCLNKHNIHKILLAAIMLAAKFQDDCFKDNIGYQSATMINAAHLY